MLNQFKTVLIIEDDHDVRVTLRQVYEAADFYVFTVTNGNSALELLSIIPVPKLIVCDLRMPLMDGHSFIEFKNHDEKLRKVPLIVISAYPEKFQGLTDVTCLQKPLDLSDIVARSQALVRS